MDPLRLEDLAKTICIINLHAPTGFEHKFHGNKRVANSPLRGIEHESPGWEPTAVTIIPLVCARLLILLCVDIQLKALKCP